MVVLGIETSCDETAASVVADGTTILSSVVASQVEIHHAYGGVVPELASRKHMEAIVPVVREAVASAGISARDIQGIAATQGPGLVGALLVGFSFAKAYSFVLKVPWVGVNHLDGHIHAAYLAPDPPDFPFMVLLASGGHTAIYHVESRTRFRRMGQTLDDAAGEAYDKVAKMLGLGYPGGPVIDRLAASGDPGKVRFPRVYLDRETFDFSFSGIKTAVKRHIQTHDDFRSRIPDIAAGFQESVVEVLSYKLIRAASEAGCRHVAMVGGVAANRRLREKITADAVGMGICVHIPPVSLCGDNAAMIAAAGYHLLARGEAFDWRADVFSRGR